jgi:hypothetical protein
MVNDDDLTSFEEACNKVDAEGARRSELDEVARLAKPPKLEYDRQREEAAARLRVRVPTLDKAVAEKRSAVAAFLFPAVRHPHHIPTHHGLPRAAARPSAS